jgi:hypothetical protein
MWKLIHKKNKVKSLFFLLSFYYILWIRVKLQRSICPIRYFETPTCECHNSNKCSLKHSHIKIPSKNSILYTCLFHIKSAYLILWSFCDFLYHQNMCLSYSSLLYEAQRHFCLSVSIKYVNRTKILWNFTQSLPTFTKLYKFISYSILYKKSSGNDNVEEKRLTLEWASHSGGETGPAGGPSIHWRTGTSQFWNKENLKRLWRLRYNCTTVPDPPDPLVRGMDPDPFIKQNL